MSGGLTRFVISSLENTAWNRDDRHVLFIISLISSSVKALCHGSIFLNSLSFLETAIEISHILFDEGLKIVHFQLDAVDLR